MLSSALVYSFCIDLHIVPLVTYNSSNDDDNKQC